MSRDRERDRNHRREDRNFDDRWRRDGQVDYQDQDRQRYEREEHYRDRNRDRHREEDDYHRDRDRSRDRDSSYNDGDRRDWDNGKDRSEYRSREVRPPIDEQPTTSRSILMKGMKTITGEETILDLVKPYGAIEEVRLIRDKSTGESRGFAFVDFVTETDARNFMEYTNGYVTLDGCSISVSYNKSHQPSKSQPQHSMEFKDWICPQCNANNFARRRMCYQCQLTRPPHAETSGDKEIEIPTSSLVVRGLDYTSNEEGVARAFAAYGHIKEIRMMRDKTTGASRGFGFVEYHTIADATQAMTVWKTSGIRVDGRSTRICYTSKGGQGPTPEQSQWHAEMQGYMDSTYSWDPTSTSGAAKGNPHLLAIINSPAAQSRFAYDDKSGFYMDAATGVYYDPNLNHYWDPSANQYYTLNDASGLYQASDKAVSTKTPLQKIEDKQKKAKTKKTIQEKKLSSEVQRWNKKTQELHVEEAPVVVPVPVAPVEEVSKSILDNPSALPLIEAIEAELTVGNVCVLCKRQFKDEEALRKHQTLSALHKTNLEVEVTKRKAEKDSALQAAQAAEPQVEEEPEITDELPKNHKPIGFALMQKMGWAPGEGIGKNNIHNAPIEVEIRAQRAGIGSIAVGGEFAVTGSDNYREAVRKRARARFSTIEDAPEDKKNKS